GCDGADGRRDRNAAPLEGHAEWAAQVGLRPAEPDHGELGGGECEQHAEAEERREERDLVVAARGAGDERDRDSRREEDRLRRDERAAIQTAERRRQLAV